MRVSCELISKTPTKNSKPDLFYDKPFTALLLQIELYSEWQVAQLCKGTERN